MSDKPAAKRNSYFTAAQEDRSAPRTRIVIPATLRITGGRTFQTVVRDLSVSGFCAAAINPVSPGSVCWLTLPQMEALQARVVWWNNSLVGCAFAELISPSAHTTVLNHWRTDTPYRPLI